MNNLIHWPVNLDASLSPARGNLNQYEFWSRESMAIKRLLPIVSTNPYVVTSSMIPEQHNRGIQITCKFNNATVLAQFHRKQGSRGMWIGSNYTAQGRIATINWKSFLKNFGVTVGGINIKIPVILEFYPDLIVVIRIQGHGIVNPPNADGV